MLLLCRVVGSPCTQFEGYHNTYEKATGHLDGLEPSLRTHLRLSKFTVLEVFRALRFQPLLDALRHAGVADGEAEQFCLQFLNLEPLLGISPLSATLQLGNT